jgi:putative transcriptional regulator
VPKAPAKASPLARPPGGGVSATPIVNQIRRLRFDRGEMTQQALADASGVTRQTIIALEAGRYAPSLELAFRIAHALGARIEEVFQWSGTAA